MAAAGLAGREPPAAHAEPVRRLALLLDDGDLGPTAAISLGHLKATAHTAAIAGRLSAAAERDHEFFVVARAAWSTVDAEPPRVADLAVDGNRATFTVRGGRGLADIDFDPPAPGSSWAAHVPALTRDLVDAAPLRTGHYVTSLVDLDLEEVTRTRDPWLTCRRENLAGVVCSTGTTSCSPTPPSGGRRGRC